MRATLYEHPFLRHLLDAILLIEMAEELPHLITSRHAALARGSIVAATLSVEAAANSLLEPIQAPKGMLRLLDQAHVVDKFEMVLFANQPEKALDRGTRLVQAIGELFQVRNKYVHPRSRETEVTQRLLGEGTMTIGDTERVSNILQLPSSPERWGVSHSRRVLCTVSDFLDYFLLDLCELPRKEVRIVLLSRLTSEDRYRLILTKDQRQILLRACNRFDAEFQVARLIAGEDSATSSAPTIKLLAVYSWARSGVQVHDQKKLLTMDDVRLTSDMVVAAAQRFLLWFSEAQGIPYGRRLLMFEIFDESHETRYVSFREYLPEPSVTTEEERSTHRPIGTVEGVERHLYFNGILSARFQQSDGMIVLEALLDTGDGREFSFHPSSVMELLEGIRLNRRKEWTSEGLMPERPETVETKGRDFEIDVSDIVTFDPTSRTAFWTYKAVSGQLVQVNMKPSTLIALRDSLRAAWLDAESSSPGPE